MSNNEQILVIPATVAADLIDSTHPYEPQLQSRDGFHPCQDVSLLSSIHAQASFADRQPAEEDPSKKQIIVYALVAFEGKILCYKRGKVGEEVRLHAKRSIGVGGHINPEDWDLGAPGPQAFDTALTRELQEELGILTAHIESVQLLGLVNEDTSPVGQVHLGLVYMVELRGTHGLVFEEALVEPIWLTEEELLKLEDLELWSSMVRDALFAQKGVVDEAVRPAYQQRVIIEKEVLDAKLAKLALFRDSRGFLDLDAEEQHRLVRQHDIMADYSQVLGERIAAF